MAVSQPAAGGVRGAVLQGLDDEEAARRLARDGPNRLPEPPRPSRAGLLASQFRNGMVTLLAGAAAVAAAFGQLTEAGLILAIVVANAALGYVQESRAEAATRALHRMLEARARVIRGGEVRTVPAEAVVVGDAIRLRPGDRVPADASLVEDVWLEVDESMLTGESLPVGKRAGSEDGREGRLMAGTTVTRGEALAVVDATGTATEIGRVAASVRAVPPRTPLQQRLDRLAGTLLRASIAVGALLGLLAWAYGDPAEEALLVGVALAVAVVPEGLPAVVTITLAVGMHRMASRGAIVRRLHAVETLGSTTVICSDKTGTLTENRMGVTRCAGAPELRVLAAARLASDPRPSAAASPEEAAIDEAARRHGLDHAALLDGGRILEIEPFDPASRRMAVTVQRTAETVTYVKGAPEVVLADVADEVRRRELGALVAEATGAGRRVLMVAEREGDGPLEGVGTIELSDPPRPSAATSIAMARRAGVRTLMITGDHPATAAAIAAELGLAGGGVLTGDDIDGLADADLARRLRTVDVVARVEPRHKLRVVDALADAGEVVAMTGDGVNDVPALAAAHIGVAMGARGTDAAIDAADMVLTDDDYSTIVRAIARGRAIHDNVARFVHYLLATNAGALILFAFAIPLGLGAPFTVPQILLVNLLTDGLPAVALGLDSPSGDVMRRRPRPLREGLLQPLRGRLGLAAATTALVCLVALLAGRTIGAAAGQTMVLATMIAAKFFYVFSVRGRGPAWRAPANPLLLAAITASAIAALVVLAVEPAQDVFGTVPLPPGLLALAAGLAAVPLVAGELLKARARRRAPDPA